MSSSRPTSSAPTATTTDDPFLTPLATPRPAFLGLSPSPSASGVSTPRSSTAPDSQAAAAASSSVAELPAATAPSAAGSESAPPIAPQTGAFESDKALAPASYRRPFWRRPVIWFIIAAAIVVTVLVIALPVALVNHKSSNRAASGTSASGDNGGGSSSSGSGTADGGGGNSGKLTTGGNGSVITLSDGSQVTYVNNFGGFWVDDPANPFSNAAQPNSWTPPLNTSWTWGKDRIYGVNLGGWLVLEPFIAPALFQQYNGTAVDEWTLSEAIAADPNSGGLQSVIEKHYSTFVTEADFIQIAGAGLNWIRLPIPFWAIETWPGEPFLPRVAWTYVQQALGWARKYGLRVYLDLHTAPGSQNAFNHSGKLGQINWLSGLMGFANAQRMLSYIREITEFISQPEYRDVVPLFGIVNEALVTHIGFDTIESFYVEAMDMIRTNITGLGAGNGPLIAIHDGFIGVSKWADYMPGTDRLVLDTHPYFAFDGQANGAPIAVPEEGSVVAPGAFGGVWPQQACQSWGNSIDGSQSAFGITVAGEFSNAINDCGLFVNGVGNGPTFSGDCTVFDDFASWNSTMKSAFNEFILASMDATQNWFFWTWKIGNSSAGTVQAPLWSYKLGLDNGWMPTDPRASIGKCAALVEGATTTAVKTYTYAPTQTGGPPTPAPPPAALAQSFPWPPQTISFLPDGVQYPALIPTYTPTGAVSTLPMPSVTAGVQEGNGWANAADVGGAFTAVAGCTYPDAWNSVGATAPTAACTGPAAPARRWEPRPMAAAR